MADPGINIAALVLIILFAAIGGWVVYYSGKGIN